eukprot:SAG11_NODE_8615_length_995_cov_1.783482_1_plen_22_part_10
MDIRLLPPLSPTKPYACKRTLL